MFHFFVDCYLNEKKRNLYAGSEICTTDILVKMINAHLNSHRSFSLFVPFSHFFLLLFTLLYRCFDVSIFCFRFWFCFYLNSEYLMLNISDNNQGTCLLYNAYKTNDSIKIISFFSILKKILKLGKICLNIIFILVWIGGTSITKNTIDGLEEMNTGGRKALFFLASFI